MWNWLKHKIITKSWKFNDIICSDMKCKPIVSLTCCDSLCGRTSNKSSRLPRSKKKKGQDEVMQVVPNFLNQEQLINIVYLKKMGITSKLCILLNSLVEPMFFSVTHFCIILTPKKKKGKKKKNILSQKHVWSFYQNIWRKQGLFSIYAVKRLANISFETANLVDIALKNRFFHNFVPQNC